MGGDRQWMMMFAAVAAVGLLANVLIVLRPAHERIEDVATQAIEGFYDRLTNQLAPMERPTEAALAEAANAVTVLSDVEREVRRDAAVRAVGGNPFQLIRQGRGTLSWRSGRLEGVRISRVDESPWAKKVGFQAGDVLLAVNDKSVVNPWLMRQIYEDLLRAPLVTVTLRRQDREVTLRYWIKE